MHWKMTFRVLFTATAIAGVDDASFGGVRVAMALQGAAVGALNKRSSGPGSCYSRITQRR